MPEDQQPSNILDLRRVIAERQAAAQHPKRLSRRKEPSLHQPERPPRDWAGLIREFSKYAVSALAVVGVLWLGQFGWKSWQTVQAAVEQGRLGAEALQQGGHQISVDQPTEASRLFKNASTAFGHSRRLLQQVDARSGHLVQHTPWMGPRWHTAMHLVAAGDQLAAAGQTVSQILPTGLADQPAVSVTTKGIVQGSIGWLQPLLQHRTKFLAAVNQALSAVDELGQVNVHLLPGSLGQALASWDQIRPLVAGPNGRLRPLVNMILGLVASPDPKDELVIFQNNDELRATGGFAGTYLLTEFNQGTFQILDSPGNGPYALTEQLPKTILPPQPLLAINPFWAFQDANWFLDAPTSARFTLDFYAKARGFRPDGVIYLTPQVMESLLKITGPVRPEHYQVDITATNFVRATEQQVEFGYDKALNNPKQFLIDLVPTMIQKIIALPGGQAAAAGLTLINAADHQQIMIVSEDDQLQQTVKQLGWDGGMMTPDDDGLAVVDSNLGGGKTDRVIEEKVDVQVVESGALLQHTVTITRQHQGQPGEALSGFTNKDFIRVLAPPNAQLVSLVGESIPDASAFFPPASGATAPAQLLAAEGQVLIDPENSSRISHDHGRTVFGFWSLLPAAQRQTITLVYTTVPTNRKSWSLLWQHQPGAPTRQWSVSYQAAGGQHIKSSTGGKVSGRKVSWQTTSESNQVFGLVF